MFNKQLEIYYFVSREPTYSFSPVVNCFTIVYRCQLIYHRINRGLSLKYQNCMKKTCLSLKVANSYECWVQGGVYNQVTEKLNQWFFFLLLVTWTHIFSYKLIQCPAKNFLISMFINMLKAGNFLMR